MRTAKTTWTALVLVGFSCTAGAVPNTYTVAGSLTDFLTDAQGASRGRFVNAAFTWQVTADTAQASVIDTHGGQTTEVPAIVDTIGIGGMVLSATIPTAFAVGSVPPSPVAGPFAVAWFVDTTALLGLAWRSAPLFGYDGTSSIGPVAVTFDNAGPLPTDGGRLSIGAASELASRADVAEPPGVAILLTGILG